MNIQNLRKLRTHLRSRKNSVGFNMATWFAHKEKDIDGISEVLYIVDKHPCGTTACLAGHAVVLAAETGCPIYNNIFSTATMFLGLTDEEAGQLFHGWWRKHGISLKEVPKSAAIKELTRLIELEEKAQP